MAQTQKQVIQKATAQGMKAMRQQEERSIKALLAAFEEAQAKLKQKLAVIFEQAGDAWDLGQMEYTGRLASLMAEVQRVIGELQGHLTGGLSNAAVEQFQESLRRSAYMLDQATPSNIAINVPVIPTEAAHALVATPYKGAMFSQRIGLISNAMASDIRDELVQSMINGESMRDAAKRVASVLAGEDGTGGYLSRAEAIARTEIMRAQNMGRASIFDANSDIMEDSAEWVATEDDRLCEWCMRRDGMSQEEIKKAPQGEDPWGNDNVPPLHPHCRCTLAPRLKSWKELGLDIPEEYEPEERAQRDEEGKWRIVSLKDYEDWKKERAL